MIYRINAQNKIIFVDDEWQSFLDENSTAETRARLASEQVLGHALWEFIADATTRKLYQALVERVRPGESVRFPLRCDGPDCTRLLEMEIVGGEGGEVEFRTSLLRFEKRTPLLLLDASLPRTEEFLRTCGWCNRIILADEWLEIAEALRRGKFFEHTRLPHLTHSICDDCYHNMTALVA